MVDAKYLQESKLRLDAMKNVLSELDQTIVTRK